MSTVAALSQNINVILVATTGVGKLVIIDRIILDPIVDDLLACRKLKKTLITCKDSRKVGYNTQEPNSRLPHLGKR